MAFIITSLPVGSRSRAVSVCPRMSAGNVSRRAALQFAALSIAGISTAALASEFSLGEVKKDVEELNYEEELTEIGPDPAEKNILRTKKKVVDPEYVAENKDIIKKEQEEYGEMLTEEKSENARIKAEFSGK